MTLTEYISAKINGQFVFPVSYYQMLEQTKSYGDQHFEIFTLFFKYLEKYEMETVALAVESILASEHVFLLFQTEEVTLDMGETSIARPTDQSNPVELLSEDKTTKKRIASKIKQCSIEYRNALISHIPEFQQNNKKYFGHLRLDRDRAFNLLSLPDSSDYFEAFSESNYTKHSILWRRAVANGKNFVCGFWEPLASEAVECICDMSQDKTLSRFLENESRDNFSVFISCVARFQLYSRFSAEAGSDGDFDVEWLGEWIDHVVSGYKKDIKTEVDYFEPR